MTPAPVSPGSAKPHQYTCDELCARTGSQSAAKPHQYRDRDRDRDELLAEIGCSMVSQYTREEFTRAVTGMPMKAFQMLVGAQLASKTKCSPYFN
jgi:hypothetical protein